MVGIQILCHACHASKKIWKDTQYEYDTPMQDSYIIRFNRESGYGRYDVILIPNDKKSGAYVLEFKVQDLGREKTLEDTAQSALNQIEQKCYDAELQDMGIPKAHITHYGFAFAGKSVLIAGQRG